MPNKMNQLNFSSGMCIICFRLAVRGHLQCTEKLVAISHEKKYFMYFTTDRAMGHLKATRTQVLLFANSVNPG